MNNLPSVSIITPTFNHKSFFPLAVHNFLSFDYPPDKLEWIILDDGEEPVEDCLPKDDRIKYFYYDKTVRDQLYKNMKKSIKTKRGKNRKVTRKYKNRHLLHLKHFKGNRIPLGMKRNICIQYASNNIIIHMDDDDYYPPNSISYRVKQLLKINDTKKQCIGCTTIGCFHINKLVSLIYKPQDGLRQNKRIICSTMAYHRDFFYNVYFDNQDINEEAVNFIADRKIVEIGWQNVIVSLFHSKNSKHLKMFNTESNGWHFTKISDELFILLTTLDPDAEEKDENEHNHEH